MLSSTQTADRTVADPAMSVTDAAHRAVTTAGEYPWRAKVAAWKEVKATAQAHYDADQEDEGEEADRLADIAFTEILNSRAPTLATMAEKGRLAINELLVTEAVPAASADNPAYLSHLMSRSWTEHALISLFQDAAALASPTPLAIADARPEPFSAGEWLTSTALQTNAQFNWVMTDTSEPDHLTFDGLGATAAKSAFDALSLWHQDMVEGHLRRKAMSASRQQAEHSEWAGPSCTAHMIRVFAEMAAWNAEQEDGEKRAVLRRRLRESMRRDVGLPIGVADFAPEAFTAEAYALGVRFKMVNPLFGPELLRRHGDDRAETKVFSERFCALDGDQVDELAAFLLGRATWAKGWVSDLERETGCVVSYHVSGIGFGIGPEHTGRLAEASAAFGTLSDRDRLDLKAFCQSKAAGDDAALSAAMSK